jgi:hypothetical protein
MTESEKIAQRTLRAQSSLRRRGEELKRAGLKEQRYI